MLSSSRLAATGIGEEIKNGHVKIVVLITCHHVPRRCDIHMARVRYELCQLRYSLCTHHSAFCAAHH